MGWSLESSKGGHCRDCLVWALGCAVRTVGGSLIWTMESLWSAAYQVGVQPLWASSQAQKLTSQEAMDSAPSHVGRRRIVSDQKSMSRSREPRKNPPQNRQWGE